MAANIESHVLDKLREFESLVTACHSASMATAESVSGSPVAGSYAVYYLTEKLVSEYEIIFALLAQQVLPLVADLKISAVRHG